MFLYFNGLFDQILHRNIKTKASVDKIVNKTH